MDIGPDLQLVNNTGLKTEQNICFVNMTVQLLKCITTFEVADRFTDRHADPKKPI